MRECFENVVVQLRGFIGKSSSLPPAHYVIDLYCAHQNTCDHLRHVMFLNDYLYICIFFFVELQGLASGLYLTSKANGFSEERARPKEGQLPFNALRAPCRTFS